MVHKWFKIFTIITLELPLPLDEGFANILKDTVKRLMHKNPRAYNYST